MSVPAGEQDADVQTTLNYYLPRPNGARLYQLEPLNQPSKTISNHIVDTQRVTIHNLRGREQDFTLDQHGFQFLAHETSEKFVHDTSIETHYYEEVQRLLMEHTGARRVIVLGHRIRHSYEERTADSANTPEERQPAHSVHGDRTFESAMSDAKQELGDADQDLLQERVRFINLWRPIGQTVLREPLAVADWRTSSDSSNLLPIYVEISDTAFHVYGSRFDRNHKWYYLRNQTPSEVILIKNYDSRTDGCARFCLHSAFHDPGSPTAAPRRKSIEVSTLLFG